MNRLAIEVIALLLLAIGALAGLHFYGAARYHAGVTAGRDGVLASDARAAASLWQQHAAIEQFSALATDGLQHDLGQQLPAIQGHTHDTVETIRTIYRDRPVPAVACSRPDGVQQALDQAVQRANAAARGELRPHAAAGAGAVRAAAAGSG